MINIFDMMGPVMVGPSSSHTAGAARIGNMGRTLLGEEVTRADIGLHGSFAETGFGHGTDRALVAGLLGMKPDDLRIPFAFQEAKKRDREKKLRKNLVRSRGGVSLHPENTPARTAGLHIHKYRKFSEIYSTMSCIV